MLRIQTVDRRQASKEYFDKSLRYADYYAEGQEIAGKWHGVAAERLGISGPVSAINSVRSSTTCTRLTGERLTPRQKSDRRPGTDFTFNAPKSVSLLHAVTGDERILTGFRRAVASAMGEIERDVKTRVRSKDRNEDRVTGNLAWAEFLHLHSTSVSGLPDPHIHIHAYVPNLTYDPIERRWRRFNSATSKRTGLTTSGLPLPPRLRNDRPRYRIDRQGRFWDVAGVPRPLIEQFSRRTSEIEKAAAERGVTDPRPRARWVLGRVSGKPIS